MNPPKKELKLPETAGSMWKAALTDAVSIGAFTATEMPPSKDAVESPSCGYVSRILNPWTEKLRVNGPRKVWPSRSAVVAGTSRTHTDEKSNGWSWLKTNPIPSKPGSQVPATGGVN